MVRNCTTETLPELVSLDADMFKLFLFFIKLNLRCRYLYVELVPMFSDVVEDSGGWGMC